MRRLIWTVLLLLAVCIQPALAAERGQAPAAGMRGGEAAPEHWSTVAGASNATERALTITLHGYREWMRDGEDASATWAEADKEQQRERREAWEQAVIRRLMERVIPIPEAYRDKFAASSKGLSLNFSKGWSVRLRFRPALELSYRFK
jgi:hypothetical protein